MRNRPESLRRGSSAPAASCLHAFLPLRRFVASSLRRFVASFFAPPRPPRYLTRGSPKPFQ